MNTPPFLLGITIVFWGWQTGITLVAVAMALVLEGSRIIKWRWELSSDDFNHIADLCSVLLLGTVIYLYGANRSTKLLLLVFQWLPLPLFPLILSLAYSTRNEIDLSSLFFITLKIQPRESEKVQPVFSCTRPPARRAYGSERWLRNIWSSHAGLQKKNSQKTSRIHKDGSAGLSIFCHFHFCSQRRK